MTERTFIYFHSMEPLTVSWALINNHHLEQFTLRGNLADLPPALKEKEVIVFVPAKDILHVEVKLPKLNRTRLMQALPFALEEQLISDVTDLHFAIGNYQVDGTFPVAVVARKKMDEWLNLLKQFSIIPAQLVSSLFALPYIEKNWSISMEQEKCTVRQNIYQGFVSELENFDSLLALGIQGSKIKPEGLHIYAVSRTPIALKENTIPTQEIMLSEEVWFEKITLWFEQSPVINLLQGNYEAKHTFSETKKIWQLASYATLAWLGLLFIQNIGSFFILHETVSRQNHEIHSIYKKYFPGATSLVTPKERLQEKLADLTDQTHKNVFLVLLAYTGNALTKTPEITLKNMDFRNNQLTLELIAAKFDDIDTLTKSLTQKGLHVKQQNASIIGNQVKVALIIERGSV